MLHVVAERDHTVDELLSFRSVAQMKFERVLSARVRLARRDRSLVNGVNALFFVGHDAIDVTVICY